MHILGGGQEPSLEANEMGQATGHQQARLNSLRVNGSLMCLRLHCGVVVNHSCCVLIITSNMVAQSTHSIRKAAKWLSEIRPS